MEESPETTKKSMAEQLPEGFFDNPKQDAKVSNINIFMWRILSIEFKPLHITIDIAEENCAALAVYS
jgi:hypothetical protein